MLQNILYISYDRGFLSFHCRETVMGLVDKGLTVRLAIPSDAEAMFEMPAGLSCMRILAIRAPAIISECVFQGVLCMKILSMTVSGKSPDLIYARQNYLAFAPVLLARILGIAYFAEINGIISERPAGEMRRGDKLKRLFQRLSIMWASAIVCPSRTLRDRIIASYGTPAGKICIAPNGVNPALFFPHIGPDVLRESLGIEKQETVVGFIGSMGMWQGVDILKETIRFMQTTAGIKKYKFLIVGDYISDANMAKMKSRGGEGQRDMERFIQETGAKSAVVYHPYVSYEKSAGFMNICDILVAPYTSAGLSSGGGSPMKLYAYLACEKPVIITDLGEFTDADELKNANAALIIPPDSHLELAHAIMRLARDKAQMRTLAKNGRAWVMQNRKWSDSVDKIVAYHNTFAEH